MDDYTEEVEKATRKARLVAWDGCHKIYLAMDEGQASWFLARDDYQKAEGTPEEMEAQVWRWYEQSCCLRFVEACATEKADPNDTKFWRVVPQQ